MDYIYIYLMDKLAQANPGTSAYWETQELTFLYLLNALRAEIWWRLRVQLENMDMEPHARSECVQQLEAYRKSLPNHSYQEILTILDKSLDTAFYSEKEQEAPYRKLLEKLNQFAQLCSEVSDNPSCTSLVIAQCCEKADEILADLENQELAFPPLSKQWEMVIPVKLSGGQWDCRVYQENKNRRSAYRYCWAPATVSAETMEFNSGLAYQSDTTVQEGRVYYRNGRQMRCLYPFVQINLSSVDQMADSIWLLRNLEHYQNGGCRGSDLLSTDPRENRSIAEFVNTKLVSSNPYVAFSGEPTDNGNTFPMHNVYAPNYQDWCNSLETINKSIRKLKSHLNTPGCSLIYVYGSGGVGKTAAVQRLLEEYDRPSKYHTYEIIIFLSAKKHTWHPANGMVNIQYEESKGFLGFRDLNTLRSALTKILCTSDEAQAANLPGQNGTEQPIQDSVRLFNGKSILLVLDDFESVSNSEQAAILQYLQEQFYAPPQKTVDPTSRERGKRRQVIITSRISTIEGNRADVELAKLDEDESVCLAMHFAHQFQRAKPYEQALGKNKETLSDPQRYMRQRLLHVSRGTPLVILSLVRNYRDANIPNLNIPEEELLTMLTKDTYHYLGNNEHKALAVLAAHLTYANASNSKERLKFVWKQKENEDASVDILLKLLRNYSVIQMEHKLEVFQFTSAEMRENILQQFQADREKDQVAQFWDQRLAQWLSYDQHLSIEDSLYNRLKKLVRWCYLPQQKSQNGELRYEFSDITSLAHLIFRYELPKWKKRSVIQLLVEAHRDFPGEMTAAEDFVGQQADINLYAVEQFRTLLHAATYREDSNLCDALKDSDSQNEPLTYLQTAFRDSNDGLDQLLMLWGSLQLLLDLKKKSIPLLSEWRRQIASMEATCAGNAMLLCADDRELLQKDLRQVYDILPGRKKPMPIWCSAQTTGSSATVPTLFKSPL